MSLSNKLSSLSHIAAERQSKRRTPQAVNGLAIADERVGQRVGVVEIGGNARERLAQSRLGSPPVEILGLSTLKERIRIPGLQSEAEVFFGPAGEPLDLFLRRDPIAIDERELQDALMQRRSIQSLSGRPPRNLLGFIQPIQAHIGVHFAAIGVFRPRFQSKRFLALLQLLFELPNGCVIRGQFGMETELARVIPDTRSSGIHHFVQIATTIVVVCCDVVPLKFRSAIH